MNLDDLDPDSPEYDAALEEAQRLEDEANGNLEAKGNEDSDDDEQHDDDNPTNQSADPEANANPATAVVDAGKKGDDAAAKPEPKVAGVLGKDGKHVLPYAALQAERRAARTERSARERAEARAAELEQQIADLKAGKTPKTEKQGLTDEELAALEEIEEDMPTAAAAARALRAANAELEALRAKNPAKDETATDDDGSDPLQDDIESVPLLHQWQLDSRLAKEDTPQWTRAVAIDNALKGSPKWAGKPQADRFAHVARMVAEEFDIEIPDDAPPPENKQPQTPPNKATTAIGNARRQTPNTLSDFKGGAVDTDLGRIENLPTHKLRSRFETMTDAEIDAHLAKSGG